MPGSTYSLALETSSSLGSLALFRDQVCLTEETWKKSSEKKKTFSHSEFVTAKVQKILNENSLKLSDIKSLYTSHGPGSFTGIRVALNLIKTFSYSLDLPIHSFNSLDLVAENVPVGNQPLLVLRTAVKNQFYAATFEPVDGYWKSLVAPKLILIEDLNSLVNRDHDCVGSGLDFLPLMSDDLRKHIHPLDRSLDDGRASQFMRLSLNPHNLDSPIAWKDLAPLYLKLSAAEEKMKDHQV